MRNCIPNEIRLRKYQKNIRNCYIIFHTINTIYKNKIVGTIGFDIILLNYSKLYIPTAINFESHISY